MQKCEGSAGSAGGKGRDAPPGGKGKPKGKGRKGKPKHGTNGKILPLEFVAAMVGGACTPLEFMAVMAGDTGTKLALSLLKALKLPVSDKPNAKYDTHDMYRILLVVFSHENNQSSMDGACRADRGPGGPKKLISRTRALEIIRGVRHDYMLKRCGNAVARSMARARRHGMLRRPIDAAIDMYDIPLYAKGLMKYAVYSKYKRGTKKFVRLATIHCVVAGQRLTPGAAVVRRGERPPIWWSGCRGGAAGAAYACAPSRWTAGFIPSPSCAGPKRWAYPSSCRPSSFPGSKSASGNTTRASAGPYRNMR